jgi:hypothetical protein
MHSKNQSTQTADYSQSMLLRTIQKQPKPVSAFELEQLWQPTFSRFEIDFMLNQLQAMGLIKAVPNTDLKLFQAMH